MSVFENSRVAFFVFSLGLAFCVFSWVRCYKPTTALQHFVRGLVFFALLLSIARRMKKDFLALLSMHAIFFLCLYKFI